MMAPLHPIFVHFTVALTGASFAFEAMGFFSGVTSLVAAGGWALAGSLFMTIFTIATGITSRRRLPVEEGEARSFLRAHMALGPIFFGLLVAAGVWRAALCRSLLQHEAALWAFIRQDVELTNNPAERALRPVVLWRKGSFGTQSYAGSEFAERILTTVATLHQQNRQVLDYVTTACEAALRHQPAPSLLPATVTTPGKELRKAA